MLDGISVVIITRNAETTLGRTLEACRDFPEIIIYDNGSEDTTGEIAASYSNVRFFRGEFMGFGPTKRHAVSLAGNDWILSLDADEKPTPKLIDTLSTWSTDTKRHVAGSIRRENFMLGKAIRHSGWGNDWLIRFFNRRNCNFNTAMVHEAVETTKDTQVVRLVGTIEHLAVEDVSQFLEKINRYSSIRANEARKAYHPFLILLKTFFAFVRTYLFRGGFLDGWRGLVIAFSNANGVFWKYMKAYVKLKNKS